jgi:hypothetical protein
MLPRYAHVLLRHLQDVRANNVIKTCKTSMPEATVMHYIAAPWG